MAASNEMGLTLIDPSVSTLNPDRINDHRSTGRVGKFDGWLLDDCGQKRTPHRILNAATGPGLDKQTTRQDDTTGCR